MQHSLVNTFTIISQSKHYWLSLIVCSVGLLSVALYYQYALEEPPCIMCIHVRLWLALLIVVSIVGLVLPNNKIIHSVTHSAVMLIGAGLVERSYLLLGTERGFVFGDCGFSLGLPAWFAVEEWLPWLFQIETSCGYTPEIVFGITMAESLMVLSVLLLIVSFGVALGFFIKSFR